MKPLYPTWWRWTRRLLAALCGLFGGGLVVVVVVIMNMDTLKKPEAEPSAGPAVSIKRAPKPPPAPRPKPKPRKARTTRSNRPPPPNLAANLSGVALDLPAFSGLDLGQQTDLLGDGAATEDLVMTADTVDSAPRPMRRVPPRYPPRANAQRVEGYVKLSYLVDARGQAKGVRVLDAQPPGTFDQAAIDAVRQWEYSPATYKGQPVQMRITQTIRFKL